MSGCDMKHEHFGYIVVVFILMVVLLCVAVLYQATIHGRDIERLEQALTPVAAEVQP